jgi:threonine-phosphate decarboxylase
MKPLPNHGGQLRQIAERFGVPVEQLIDFSANINPEGPPPAVLPALIANLQNADALTSYPDLEQIELKQAIALYAGTSAHNLAVANGFVPLLDATLRTLPIRHCLIPVPAFVEYRPALTRAGIKVTSHLLEADNDFAYNIDSLLEGDHDSILLANPQNPTGIATSKSDLLNLVSKAATRNIVVLLDEAFIDYIPDYSITSYVENYPNLIVFRSVTKFHAIPGLRVAYMAAAQHIPEQIEENLPPWAITTLAAFAVIAALPDHSYAANSRLLNQQRRTLLQSQLIALGLHVYESAANYILFRLPPGIHPEKIWQHMIVSHHVVLRACSNYENLSAAFFRIAVRTPDENALLIAALSSALRCSSLLELPQERDLPNL